MGLESQGRQSLNRRAEKRNSLRALGRSTFSNRKLGVEIGDPAATTIA